MSFVAIECLDDDRATINDVVVRPPECLAVYYYLHGGRGGGGGGLYMAGWHSETDLPTYLVFGGLLTLRWRPSHRCVHMFVIYRVVYLIYRIKRASGNREPLLLLLRRIGRTGWGGQGGRQ